MVNTSRRDNVTPCFTSLFSYETDVQSLNRLLQLLNEKCYGNINNTITHVCLGASTFLRFWPESPEGMKNVLVLL